MSCVSDANSGPISITANDAGDRLNAAVYAVPDGTEYRQEARQFVLAAGGVERADPSRQSADVLRDGFAVSSCGKSSISQQLVRALL